LVSQDFDLFVALAEIAGVFVGFGALISFARGDQVDETDLGRLRFVVTIGLVVIVAALVPVGLGRYGVAGRALWGWSSGIFLTIIWLAILSSIRDPESRRFFLSQARENPGASIFLSVFLEVPIQVPLFFAALGILPSLGAAFYTTALILNLCEAAMVLALLVFSRSAGTGGQGGRPAT
jgi:hypothetical protein